MPGCCSSVQCQGKLVQSQIGQGGWIQGELLELLYGESKVRALPAIPSVSISYLVMSRAAVEVQPYDNWKRGDKDYSTKVSSWLDWWLWEAVSGLQNLSMGCWSINKFSSGYSQGEIKDWEKGRKWAQNKDFNLGLELGIHTRKDQNLERIRVHCYR